MSRPPFIFTVTPSLTLALTHPRPLSTRCQLTFGYDAMLTRSPPPRNTFLGSLIAGFLRLDPCHPHLRKTSFYSRDACLAVVRGPVIWFGFDSGGDKKGAEKKKAPRSLLCWRVTIFVCGVHEYVRRVTRWPGRPAFVSASAPMAPPDDSARAAWDHSQNFGGPWCGRCGLMFGLSSCFLSLV